MVTSAFEASTPARALAFLPTADSPWTGLVAASLRDGGFEIFNVEGRELISTSGPQLNSIAGASDFALRGEVFPLLFGVDTDGALRGFAVLQQADDVAELPLEGDELIETAAAVCTFDSGIGYVDLVLLGENPEAAVVRVRDTGGDGLTLTEQARLPLPFAARSCAGADGDLIVAGPTSGVARLDLDGETRAFVAGMGVADIGYATLLGRPAVMAASSDTGRLSVFDARTLDMIADVETEAGLNAPAFDTPTALAVTSASYGGMAFSSGLVAVYDRADSRVKIVAREVVARAVVSPES